MIRKYRNLFISLAWLSVISRMASGGMLKTETLDDFMSGQMENVFLLNGPSGKLVLDSSLEGLDSVPLNYSSLPSTLSKFGALQVGGRLYVVGGVSSDNVSRKAVFSVSLNSLGPVGSWRSEASLPDGLSNPSLLNVNGKLVVVPSLETRNILSATINNTDGVLSFWSKVGELPLGIQVNSCTMIGRRLLLVASDGTGLVFSAAFSPTGNVTNWRVEEEVPAKLSGFTLVSNSDRIFLLGGLNTSGSVTTGVFSLNSAIDGSIGSWVAEPSLPIGLGFHSAAVSHNFLIISGGNNGSSLNKTIYSTTIDITGHLSGWEKQYANLVSPIQNHRTIFSDQCLLIMGGESSSAKQSRIISFSFRYSSTVTAGTTVGAGVGAQMTRINMLYFNNRLYYVLSQSSALSFYSVEIGQDGKLKGSVRAEVGPTNIDNTYPVGQLHRMGGRVFLTVYPLLSTAKIYSTTLNNDGSFTGWVFIGDCPNKLTQFSSIFIGSRLFLIGGKKDNLLVPVTDIYSSSIDETGTMSAWKNEAALPVAKAVSAVHMFKDRLIVAGGQESSGVGGIAGKYIYSAGFDSNGSISDWKRLSDLPSDMRSPSINTIGNRIYIGSPWKYVSGTTVYNTRIVVSQMNEFGDLGPWGTFVDSSISQNVFLPIISINGFTYYVDGTSLIQFAVPIVCKSGVYYSKIIDLFSIRNLYALVWNRLANPSNTSMAVSLASAADQSSPLDSFTEMVNGLSINKLARFVQLQFRFKSSDGTASPGLDDFTITHYNDSTHPSGAPVLNVVDVTTTSLTVSLQDRSVGEEAFQFFLSRTSPPAGDPIAYTSVVGSSGTTTNYTFDGLLHGTTYYLRARGWNAADSIDGAYSNLIGIQTPSLDLKRRLSTELLGFDSVVIGWPRVDNAIAYRVFDEGNNLLATKSSSTLSFTETVLSPNTQLFRRIEASDSVGVIQVGSVVLYTGLAAPLATDFSIESQGDNWINIQVTPPVNAAAGLSGTKIILRSEGTIVRTARLKNKESTYRFDSLPVGRGYQITTSYLNGDGIESMESPVLETFVGLASEAFAPAKDKFRISDGIDFPIESNVPVMGTLKIYDSQQRKLREIPIDSPAGHSVVHWDGRDDSGNPVYSGVYWAVSETDHFGRKTFKVAGIR